MASRGDSLMQVELNPSSEISLCQSSSSPPSTRACLEPAPPASQQLSFSISRILGLGEQSVQPQRDALLVCQESNDQIRQNSDHSPTVDSDNPSTDVDSGRESDDAARPEPSSERPRKKKQRTTFSPIEVYELEKVFAQRPYLMPEDEDELVQRLGLTARNVRFWFQNRRAKLRRQERAPANIPQSFFQNHFDRPPLPAHAPCGDIQFWKPIYHPHAGFQGPLNLGPNHAVYSQRNIPPYTRAEKPCPCCPIQPHRFQLAEMDLPPNNAEVKPSQLLHSEGSPAFLERLPRLPSNQFYKASDDKLRSRDYTLQGQMGVREYEK